MSERSTNQRGRPTQAELLTWMDSLSNWGRWGAEDQRGTLNLVTPQVTLQATRLVKEGVTVSCARTWSYEAAPDVDPRRVPQHYMLASGEAYRPGDTGKAFETTKHLEFASAEAGDGDRGNGLRVRAKERLDL